MRDAWWVTRGDGQVMPIAVERYENTGTESEDVGEELHCITLLLNTTYEGIILYVGRVYYEMDAQVQYVGQWVVDDQN